MKDSMVGSGGLIRAPSWMVFGVPFVALTLLTMVALRDLDTSVFYSINSVSSYTGPGLWAHLTILGDGLVCAVFLLPWIRKHPDRVWGGLLGALFMFVVLRSFKGFLNLPRPLGVLPPETVMVIGPGHRKSAFPSGHTATIFLFFGIWALTERRRWLSLALLFPPLLVGFSRIVVGVHWPTDVLAGMALGWVSAWLGLRWAERTPWGMGRRAQRILAVLLVISAVVMISVDHTGYPDVMLFQRIMAATCLLWGGWELRGVFRGTEGDGIPGVPAP